MLASLWWAVAAYGQEEMQAELLSQLEQQAEAGNETEDDAQWQQLHALSKHKINLNNADEETLQLLGLLSALEIGSFLHYRNLLGPLLSIYELQAIPGFDLPLIRRLLPYVRVGDADKPLDRFRDYSRKGQHTVLFRLSHPLNSDDSYVGSPDKMMFRYRYSLPRYISWGVTGEKDAGEQFLRGAQQYGFDFYSAHLFVAKYKQVQAIALGDYVVNLGQGLIQWHSLALGKGTAVMRIKREAEVLRPYTSAGEAFFFRGAGITLKYGRWQGTVFGSLRKLDAGVGEDSNSVYALVNTGYHRTPLEISKRENVRQLSLGGNISRQVRQGHIGLNLLVHQLDLPLEKEPALYNKFAFTGNRLLNVSADYAKGFRNLHLFGEAALDAQGQLALLQGILASLSNNVDVSMVYRQFARAYQSLYANAFTASSKPANERGWYTGVSLKISPRWELAGYADLFTFPWLKYRVDAPSTGMDVLLLLTWRPSKQVETALRYIYGVQEQNINTGSAGLRMISSSRKSNVRWHTDMKLSPMVSLKARLELNWKGTARGWLAYQEWQAKIGSSPARLGGRLTRFDVGGDGNGLYASENGMLYDYAMSRFAGTGWQYYLNFQYRLSKELSCWLRVHRTDYTDVQGKVLLQCQLMAKW